MGIFSKSLTTLFHEFVFVYSVQDHNRPGGAKPAMHWQATEGKPEVNQESEGFVEDTAGINSGEVCLKG
jgi:hypothetical protein